MKSISALYESTFPCSSLKLSLIAVCELEILDLLSQRSTSSNNDATLVILVQGMEPRYLSSFLLLKPFLLKANLSP